MRLFFALVPPRPIRERLHLAMGGLIGARWQSDAQLHATMRFIGDADRHQAEALCMALERMRLPAISARLDGYGWFARQRRVDQLWAGLSPRAPLAELHARLDRLCVMQGWPPEGRRFVPHVTLARFGRGAAPDEAAVAGFVADRAPLDSPAFAFDQLHLMHSDLTHAGSHYTTIGAFRFG